MQVSMFQNYKRIGVVGSEQAKFTRSTERKAREAIERYLVENHAEVVVSGGCHLGGVDIYAEDIAAKLGLDCIVHRPRVLRWSDGYMLRNLSIVADSDIVVCVTLKEYPIEYDGLKFNGCYHCKDYNPPHVKSGGCWTAWKSKKREWIYI